MTVPDYRQASGTPSVSNASIVPCNLGPFPPGNPLAMVWTPLQRIHLLNDFLISHLNEYGDSNYWQRWANEFFAPEATLSLTLPKDVEDAQNSSSSLISNTPLSSSTSVSSSGSSSDIPKKVCIPRALIPRFFWTWAQSGMCRVSLRVERIKEMMLPNGHLLLDSNQCQLLSHLDNGLQIVEHSGPARILFGANSKILYLDLNLLAFEHYISSKSQCLFTLPLKCGFDQAVHQFLDLQAMVQVSATRMPGYPVANSPVPRPMPPTYQPNTIYPPMMKPNPAPYPSFVPQGWLPTKKPILPNGIPMAVSPVPRLRTSNRGKKPRVQNDEDSHPPVLKFEEYQPPVAREPKGSEAASCS